jgi:hypothetical protein
MDVDAVRDPLPADSRAAFTFRRLGSFPSVGRENTSHPCSCHCCSWSDCSGEGLPQASLFACPGAHGNWPGLHLRWRILGQSPSIARGGGSRHPSWQRLHDRRAQNQSHILSRLQLQPLRLNDALTTGGTHCSPVTGQSEAISDEQTSSTKTPLPCTAISHCPLTLARASRLAFLLSILGHLSRRRNFVARLLVNLGCCRIRFWYLVVPLFWYFQGDQSQTLLESHSCCHRSL